jgi:hypothetical protein
MLTAIRDSDDGFDADSEIKKLLLLVMRKTVSSEKAPARKPSTLQSNTQIPPPVRFTRKNKKPARNSLGQAQVAIPSTIFHQPSSAQLPVCSLSNVTNEPCASDYDNNYDKIYAALLLDDDYPDTKSSAESLNTLVDIQ